MHSRSIVFALMVPLAGACGSVDESSSEPDASTAPTYWQDVEPIFYTHCAMCHTAGGIGPFEIDDPDTAAAYSAVIALETQAGRMPPWPPGGDTPPMLHERMLDDASIETIRQWAEAGAPIGDPDRPGEHVEPDVVDIGEVDLSFDIGVDYEPDGALTDDYRCFLADIGELSDTRIATGYRVTPGNGKTVHHVIVGLYAGADRAALEALDAESERAGWECFAGLVPDQRAQQIGSIGGWVPGSSDVAYPEGTGRRVLPGSVAVIQVHYNLAGGPGADRTRVEVALAPEQDTLEPLGALGLVKRDLDIPAGEPETVSEISLTAAEWAQLRGRAFPEAGAYLLGVGAHMHLLGSQFHITRTNADGEMVLLDIPRWDFHWQGQYTYAEPIAIAADDVITLRCVHDNSAEKRAAEGLGPPVDVAWGEGTADEMCLGSLMVVEALP